MRRVFIFVNPLAGRGRGVAMGERVAENLLKAGWAVETTGNPVDMLDAFSADAVIVIGGDGTLRGVVEHLGKLNGLSNVPPVLPIGLGTANLMQRHLGLQYTARTVGEDVVAYLNAGRTRAVDMGVVNDKLFLLMAGCGFDAAVVQSVADQRRGPITKWTYVMPTIELLTTAAFPPITVEVDGEAVLQDQPAQVFVGNVSEYGTGFSVLPGANSGDGLLDVCVLPCDSRLGLAIWQTFIVRGKHIDHPNAIYRQAKRVRITGDVPMPLQIDGDAAGTTPADIRLLGEQVHFIVA